MSYQQVNSGQSMPLPYNSAPNLTNAIPTYHQPPMYSAPPGSIMIPNTQGGFQNRRKRRGVKRPANDGKMIDALKKLERVDTLEDQVNILLKEKEEAAEAARKKILADEAEKMKIAKAELAAREKLLDEREAKLEEATARLEESKARLAEEKRAFEEGKALAAREQSAKQEAAKLQAAENARKLPWYRRQIF